MGLRTKTRALIRSLRAYYRNYRAHYTYDAYLTRLTQQCTDMRVAQGPFRGMQYVDRAHSSVYLPKLLGIYEREIYPVIERAISGEFDLVVDVGAAEGYFAVGMAWRGTAPVVAFELNDGARQLAREMALSNGVQNKIDLRPACSPAALEGALACSLRPFVLVDVEGYETTLLHPDRVPALRRAAILVEMHEFARPGSTAEFYRLFADTHQFEMIWQTERGFKDFPFTDRIAGRIRGGKVHHIVGEKRGFSQSWLWMTPKARATAIDARPQAA